MALIKTDEQRELQELNEVEKRIEKRARRERIHHLLIGGLAVLAIGAYFLGRNCNK